MDKPVVSAFEGQFRDVGLRWGGKMIDSSLGASSTPPRLRPLTLYTPFSIPSPSSPQVQVILPLGRASVSTSRVEQLYRFVQFLGFPLP